MAMNPKFKVGDKVVVCRDLITTVDDVQPIEDGSWLYWFKDEHGGSKFEYEHAIELYDNLLHPHYYKQLNKLVEKFNKPMSMFEYFGEMRDSTVTPPENNDTSNEIVNT